MSNKKSQITLFIILGLILLLIIGFLFYLTTYVVKKQTGTETTETQKIKTELQPIVNYVTQCLDQTTKEGLVLLGKQGGYLYASLVGLQEDFETYLEGYVFINYPSADPQQVLYGITPLRPGFVMNGPPPIIYYSDVPNYPWQYFPYTDYPTMSVKTFGGFFGENRLPFIDMIETQLEAYIKNNITDCVDWSIFEEQGYEITEKNLNANLEIAKEDLVVRLVYPLTIKSKVTGDTTTIEDFFVREKVRLKKIHDAVNSLVENDIRNIDFDIEWDGTLISGLSVQVIRDFYDEDDIIIVEDANSLINGVPYKFIFARRNRGPALEEITSAVNSGDCNSLLAHDPDEDSLNFDCSITDSKVTVTDDELLEDYQTGVTITP